MVQCYLILFVELIKIIIIKLRDDVAVFLFICPQAGEIFSGILAENCLLVVSSQRAV